MRGKVSSLSQLGIRSCAVRGRHRQDSSSLARAGEARIGLPCSFSTFIDPGVACWVNVCVAASAFGVAEEE